MNLDLLTLTKNFFFSFQEKDVNSNSDSDQKQRPKVTEELTTANLSVEPKDISTETCGTSEKTLTVVKKRRKFKQLIIEEDSEKIVEYIREDYDSSLNQSTQESPIDAELAGIKHDLESPDTTSERLKDTQTNTEMSLEELTRDLESSNTSADILSKDEDTNESSVTEESTTLESSVKNNTTSKLAIEEDHHENISRRSSRLRGSHIAESPEVSTETKKSKRKGLEAKSSHSEVESITKESADIKKGKSRSRKDSDKDHVKQEAVIEKTHSDDVEKQPLRRGRSRKNEPDISDVTLLQEHEAKIENAENKTPTESDNLTAEPLPSAENVSPKSRKRSRRKLSSSSPSGNLKEVEHEEGLRTRSQKHRKIHDSNENTSAATSLDDTSKNIEVETLKPTIETEKEISSDTKKSDADKVTENTEVLKHENSNLKPTEKDKLPEEILNAEELNVSEGKVDFVVENKELVDVIPKVSENENIKDDLISETVDSSEKDVIKSARKGRSTRSSAVHEPSAKNLEVDKLMEQSAEVNPSEQLEEVITPRRRRGRSQLNKETVASISETTASSENTTSRSSKSNTGAKQKATTDHICADNEPDSKYEISDPVTDVLSATEKNVSGDIETNSKHKAASTKSIEDVTTPKKKLRSRRSNESAKDTTVAQDSGSSEKLVNPENAEKSGRTLRSDASKSRIDAGDVTAVDRTNQKNEVAEASESSKAQVEDVSTVKRRRGRSQRFNKSVDNLDAKQDSNSLEKIVSPENTENVDATEVSPNNEIAVPDKEVSLPAACEAVEQNQSAAEPEDSTVCIQKESETPVKITQVTVECENKSVDQVEDVSSSELSRMESKVDDEAANEGSLDDTKTTSPSAEVFAVSLEEIPLPEPPVEVAMLDIPVEDIPLPPSPSPEAHKPKSSSVTKVVDPEEHQESSDSVQVQSGTREQEPQAVLTNTTVFDNNHGTDFSNIELESIPIPVPKTDDKEKCQEQAENSQDASLTFSLEDIPFPEPINTSENDSSCDTNEPDKPIQSIDMPKSPQQDDLEMADCQQLEQDNKVEASFNLENIPISTTTPQDENVSQTVEIADVNVEENAQSQIETSQNPDSAEPTDLQRKLESPKKSVFTDVPATTVKSFEDFMQKHKELNTEVLEEKPQNAGIVCDTIYEQKPEVRRSGRTKKCKKRWDVPESTVSSVVESGFQPEDVLSAHDTSESQNVAHSDVETEDQSKQFGQLENSDASLSEATFTTGLENLSNNTFEETQQLDQKSSETVPEESEKKEDRSDQSSAAIEKPDLNQEDPVSEHANENLTNLTESAETPELVTAESEETCNTVKSRNRGRRKQVLSAESEPAVEFTSNNSNLVEKPDENQEVYANTAVRHISAEDTIDAIFETEKNKDSEKNEGSFSFRGGQSSKQTQPLDQFKTLFDDEVVASPQPELKSSTKDYFHEHEVGSPETAVNKTITSTESEIIILPLKKSKRVNEISSLISSDSFTKTSDTEFSFRSACDESFMSTSMRNNIDRLINEIDSVDTSGIETLSSSSLDSPMFSQIVDTEKSNVLEPLVTEWKSVPPKKKKVDVNEPQPDDKPEESVPQAPKKKMQKLFESSKSPKSVDVPLMSPLAKKKSFYFQHDFEKFEQSLLTKDGSHSNSEDSSADEAVDPQESPAELDQPTTKEEKDKKLPEQNCDTSNLSKCHLESSTPTTEVEIEPPTDKDEKSIPNLIEPAAEQVTQPEKETEPLEGQSSSNQETVKCVGIKKEEPEVKVPASAEPELIPITVAPTVMSEKDLDDAQVEITSDVVISEKKPSSLGSFSVKFDTAIITKTDNLTTMKGIPPKIPDTVGTEFTSKAMVKEFDNKSLKSQPNTYALKSELLDILEGNSNSSTNSSGSEQKFKTSFDNYDKKNTVQGIIDFEDAIPPQIVITNKINTDSVLLDSPKLLERLSMSAETGVSFF